MKRLAVSPDRIVIMEDHDRAYHAWKERGISKRTLVHVDAHIDFGWIPDMDFDEIGLDGKSVERLLQERPLLNPFMKTRKKMVNIGNYICPAMKDGIVEKFYWVVPDESWRSGRGRKHIIKQLRHILRIDRYAGGKLEIHRDYGRCRIFDKEVIVCGLENLERIDVPVLLDIDTDFMLTRFIWDDLNPERAPWILPEELFEKIAQKINDIDVLTIAYSVEGWFTPLKHKHLGDDLRLLFDGTLPENETDETRRKKDAAGYFNLCLTSLEGNQAQVEKARHFYQKAVECDRSYATPYNNYGILYLQQNMPDKARKEFEKFLQLDGNNTSVLSGLGYIALGKRRYAEADAFFERVLSMRGDHREAIMGKGMIDIKAGRLKMAEEAFAGLQKRLPEDSEVRWWLGRIAEKNGDVASAIDHYKNAVMLGGEGFCVHIRLFRLYVKNGLYYRAFEELKRSFQALRHL